MSTESPKSQATTEDKATNNASNSEDTKSTVVDENKIEEPKPVVKKDEDKVVDKVDKVEKAEVKLDDVKDQKKESDKSADESIDESADKSNDKQVDKPTSSKKENKDALASKEEEMELKELGQNVFEAEGLLKSRKRKGIVEYLVKWKGFSGKLKIY